MGFLGQGAGSSKRVVAGDIGRLRSVPGVRGSRRRGLRRTDKAGYVRVMSPEQVGRAVDGRRRASRNEAEAPPFRGVELDQPIQDLSRAVDGGLAQQRTLLRLAHSPRDAMPVWKRALDLVIGSMALLLLSPLFLLTAAYIKLVSPGPILFRQERMGLRGQSFELLKFRSMHHQAETVGHQSYLDELRTSDQPMRKLDGQGDARLIRLGRLIRATALDELPQLLNVLRGDMSLVGPRPAIPYEYETYEPWQRLRFCSVPGMTGLWQVTGKNHTTFSQMIRLDTRYALTKRLGLDLKILFLTPRVLVGQVVELVKQKKGA